MSEHLTESQILALASEQETVPAPWREHVAECPVCRDKLADFRATWVLLGCWQAPARLDQPSTQWQASLAARVRTQSTLLARWRPVMVRVAASVLLAVGIGLGAAWYSAPVVADDPSQLAAGSLYLDALSAKRSIGLESALGVAGVAEVQP